MSAPTHAVTVNGRTNLELGTRSETAEQSLRKRLSLMDGTVRYAVCVWRLPRDVPFEKVDLKHWPQEYIQAAGSSSEMTVEVRRFEDGVARQYVVGRAEPEEPDSEVVIHWNGARTTVLAREVFSAQDAEPIFLAYLRDGWAPEGYVLRLLDLNTR